MDKCRVCLGINRKNLLSIFAADNGISYADMLSSVANVKILKDSPITEQICMRCRKKLRDVYDFKILIERSDAALYETNNLKKLNFNHIDDIKIEIKLESDNKPLIPKCEDMTEYFKDGVNQICYSNTVIKKVDNFDNEVIDCKKPIPVLDFLKTIKGEPDLDDNYDNYDYEPDSDGYGDADYVPRHKVYDSDADYIPHMLLKQEKVKRKYKKSQKGKQNGSTEKENDQSNKAKQVCIKPVFMKDLKLVQSRPERKEPKKQVYHARTQMCPHCGKMTKTLKSHILQHTGERTFKCEVCGKGFFTRALLSHHLKKHSNNKSYKCDQCVAAFIDRPSLRSHMLSHSDEKKFVCEICSKAFKRRCAMRRHALGHNSANKTIMCDLCNMSFFSKYGLRHHMRVHTGERPYNCEICSQPYSYKHDFNRHCFKKHGVFLKRRSVYVMNEEVLKQEKILMRDLMLRVHGIIKDGEPLNPFEGPQAAQAFEQAVKALESRQIPIDFQI